MGLGDLAPLSVLSLLSLGGWNEISKLPAPASMPACWHAFSIMMDFLFLWISEPNESFSSLSYFCHPLRQKGNCRFDIILNKIMSSQIVWLQSKTGSQTKPFLSLSTHNVLHLSFIKCMLKCPSISPWLHFQISWVHILILCHIITVHALRLHSEENCVLQSTSLTLNCKPWRDREYFSSWFCVFWRISIVNKWLKYWGL